MARPLNQTSTEYFMSAFEICTQTGCWNWTRSTYSHGYGRIPLKIKGKWCHRPAHRFGYQLLVGPIPKGMQANHKCDNRRCVNPEHIFIGTQRDNIEDMHKKQRHAFGERHVHALLTADAVRFIRKNYKPRHREFGFAALARKFKTDDETIRDAFIGRTWKWVK